MVGTARRFHFALLPGQESDHNSSPRLLCASQGLVQSQPFCLLSGRRGSGGCTCSQPVLLPLIPQSEPPLTSTGCLPQPGLQPNPTDRTVPGSAPTQHQGAWAVSSLLPSMWREASSFSPSQGVSSVYSTVPTVHWQHLCHHLCGAGIGFWQEGMAPLCWHAGRVSTVVLCVGGGDSCGPGMDTTAVHSSRDLAEPGLPGSAPGIGPWDGSELGTAGTPRAGRCCRPLQSPGDGLVASFLLHPCAMALPSTQVGCHFSLTLDAAARSSVGFHLSPASWTQKALYRPISWKREPEDTDTAASCPPLPLIPAYSSCVVSLGKQAQSSPAQHICKSSPLIYTLPTCPQGLCKCGAADPQVPVQPRRH